MLRSVAAAAAALSLALYTAPGCQRAVAPKPGAGLEVVDNFRADTGFYLFAPTDAGEADSLGLVVFVHGYGALNPYNYAGWIRHLVERGNVVVYPRYQRALIPPGTKRFAGNAAAGIRSALTRVADRGWAVDTNALVYIGHSYGGAISAFLMARPDSLRVPHAAGGLLCAPGTSKLTGSRLRTYTDIDTAAQLLIVSSAGDHTVGDEFSRLLFDSTAAGTRRLWIVQTGEEYADGGYGQGHNESYSPDASLDNGVHNFTFRRAESVGRTDALDTLLYWPLGDQLVAAARSRGLHPLFERPVRAFAMGDWAEGTPRRSFAVKYPDWMRVPDRVAPRTPRGAARGQ